MADPSMPDLSHLSAEERAIIEQVFQRQKAEEEKEMDLSQKAEKELDDLERQINERKETAVRLVGTQDDAICQICQKTKFADGIGHKCFYCQLRSCARCGGKVQGKAKPIWACSLCQKRQQIMAKTGKWFELGQQKEDSSSINEPAYSPTPPASAPRTPQPSQQNPTHSSAAQQPRNIPSQQQQLKQSALPPCVAQPATSSQQMNRGGAPPGAGNPQQPPLQQPGHPQHQQQHPQQGGHPQGQQRHPPPGRQATLPSASSQDPHPQHHQDRRQSHQGGMHQEQPHHRRQNTLHRQPSLETQDSSSALLRDPNGMANGAPPQTRQGGLHMPPQHHKTSITSPSNAVAPHQQPLDQRSVQSQRRPQDPQSPPYRGNLEGTGRQHSRQEYDERRRKTSLNPSGTVTPDRQSSKMSRDERNLYPEQQSHKSSFDYSEQDERYDCVPNEHYGREQSGGYSDYHSSSEVYDRDPRYDSRRRTHDSSYPHDSYSKTASTSHRSSSGAGRTSELRRTRSRGEADRLDSARKFSTPVAPPPAVPPFSHANLHSTASGGSHGRPRRNRLHRQLKSMSSSEEDLPSTSDGQSGEDGRVGPTSSSTAPEFIEKDILRYIYGSQKARNGKKSASSEIARKFGRGVEGGSLSASGTLERASSSSIMPGDMLAAKIRTYLSVSSPRHVAAFCGPAKNDRPHDSAENGRPERRFGMKVLGGRRSDTGRLGAFVTRVKPGSVADTVGRLRAGDEVLEWNGKSLQNVTFDQVYDIINASKNEPRVEMIVSRSTNVPGGDDFLNVQRGLPNLQIYEDYLFPPTEPAISHSQSMISPQLHQLFQHNSFLDSPIHKNSMPANFPFYGDAMIYPGPEPALSKGQIFGRIELSLLYLNAERELVVTVHQAMDLPPRPDGSARNPYVKIFLLPDRSEKSRRQSSVLADTLMPVWNEEFYYHGLTEPMLMTRVLEVTVWDYDKYETNSFLGETLIDFSVTQTDNQPTLFTLVDMDEENPIRNRLRQRRFSSYGPPPRPRSEMSHYPQHHHSSNQSLEMSPRVNEGDYYTQRRTGSNYQLPSSMRRSRTYDRNAATLGSGRHHYSSHYGNGHSTLPPAAEEDWTVNSNSGYLSDHAYSSQLPGRYLRRPRSATAMRPLTDSMEMGGHGSRLYNRHHHGVPQGSSGSTQGPWNTNGGPRHHHSHHGLHQQSQQSQQQLQDQNSSPGSGSGSYQHPMSRRPDPRSLNGRLRYEALQEGSAGYGSDGSETLSVNSAQSMTGRMIRRGQMGGDVDGGSGGERGGEIAARQTGGVGGGQLVDEFSMDEGGVGDPGVMQKNSVAMKERKKSLMTRLIPGRNPQLDAKRTGFARSEEVGVPEGLSIPTDRFQQQHFTKQVSKESTDSSHSDNYMPILPEGPLGNFLDDLGPGQVVGRQVLASPVLGEIELIITPIQSGLDVEVVRARNLKVKPDIKITPSPYVKIYMMEGKTVVAKAKTQSFPKTTAPQFNQHLLFPGGRGECFRLQYSATTAEWSGSRSWASRRSNWTRSTSREGLLVASTGSTTTRASWARVPCVKTAKRR
ncbi:hypothetical protein L596_016404 [Steinernema carpocapsae]|uniref:Rab-3-interacting molecule unc-10 n=2 Tax=Steinernema carpocapsae TaxID=34508 RepID=A0A4U5NJ24_STECR|nr:hypothetical protein L596_016404 [Steinernema carpocapsae]